MTYWQRVRYYFEMLNLSNDYYSDFFILSDILMSLLLAISKNIWVESKIKYSRIEYMQVLANYKGANK